jgi:predicted nucleic acid-binding protein
MYLVDTNVWLERLLGQAKSDEVGQFLDQIPSNQLSITDFAFHSLCIILTRLERKQVLLDFVQDVFINGAVAIIGVKPKEMQGLVEIMDRFNLDFDDAYQYVSAEQNNLVVVSFDSDLSNTTRGRKTPAEILMTSNLSESE